MTPSKSRLILIICIPDCVNIYIRPEQHVTGTAIHETQHITTEGLTSHHSNTQHSLELAALFLKLSVQRRLRDNYRVCPQEVWHCGGKAEQKRSEKEGTHRSTSEGFVDPWYYELSELTGYTYFTKQSTCHVLTAFGFTYEPKFLHEAP